MANNDRLDTIQILSGFPPAVKNVPPNYPTVPTPDKISLLWRYNSTDIYHRFNPYTEYPMYFGILKNKQPFVWRYPDEGDESLFGELPKQFKSLESRVFPVRSASDDAVRIGKWSVSPSGVLFYINQATLQKLQPCDETRTYALPSVMVSTIRPLTFDLLNRPTRHVEGLGDIFAGGVATKVFSVFGLSGGGFSTPGSTVGDGALPSGGGGRGLIRGTDANNALNNLQMRWPPPSAGPTSFLGGLLNSATGTAGNVLRSTSGRAKKSPGQFRADEAAADMMYNTTIQYPVNIYAGNTGPRFADWVMPWSWSGNTGKPPLASNPVKFYPTPQILSRNIITPFSFPIRYSEITIQTINDKTVGGYQLPMTMYGNTIFPAKDEAFTESEMLINYSFYLKPRSSAVKRDWISKMTDPESDAVKSINNNLKEVINKIDLSGDIRTANLYGGSKLMSDGNPSPDILGYNWIIQQGPKNKSDLKNTYGVIKEYSDAFANFSNIKSIDSSIRVENGTNLRMATSFKSDALNRISVLEKDRKIPPAERMSQYPLYTEWEPYKDDLIAFFFYDVVNEKYIPFRATVKGIAESNSAPWDELAFIGRADKLYNYTGFTRTLNFTFNVVVNSIMELLPVWKKINYMASAVKPANYTTAGSAGQKSFNRFMIPPMFMLTIGDLYKYQPVVITSVNVNIPEDAAWETLNQDNSNKWSYLNGIISAAYNLGKKYGQLPREAEIQITCNVLEKERAIIGAGHYGHAPHTDLFLEDQFNISEASDGKPALPYLPTPTDLHKNLLVYNGSETVRSWTERVKVDKAKDNAALLAAQLDEKSVYFIGPKIPPTGLPTTTGDKLAAQSQQLNNGKNALGTKGTAALGRATPPKLPTR